MKKIIYSLVLLPFSLSSINISIDEVLITYENIEKTAKNVKVFNKTKDVGFVKVDLYEIKNSKSKNEEKIIYLQNDERTEEGKLLVEKYNNANIKIGDPKNSGLFVSPNKIIIDPESYSKVRILNINKENDIERVYKIRYTPVISGFEKDKDSVGVKIITAYESLVFVEPKNIIKDINYKIDGNTVKIKNDGNTNVYFGFSKYCSDDCTDGLDFRLYPKQEKILTLDENVKHIEYIIKYSKNSENLKIKIKDE